MTAKYPHWTRENLDRLLRNPTSEQLKVLCGDLTPEQEKLARQALRKVLDAREQPRIPLDPEAEKAMQKAEQRLQRMFNTPLVSPPQPVYVVDRAPAPAPASDDDFRYDTRQGIGANFRRYLAERTPGIWSMDDRPIVRDYLDLMKGTYVGGDRRLREIVAEERRQRN